MRTRVRSRSLFFSVLSQYGASNGYSRILFLSNRAAVYSEEQKISIMPRYCEPELIFVVGSVSNCAKRARRLVAFDIDHAQQQQQKQQKMTFFIPISDGIVRGHGCSSSWRVFTIAPNAPVTAFSGKCFNSIIIITWWLRRARRTYKLFTLHFEFIEKERKW